MKQIEKFFYHACTYTVIISMIFFIFARSLGADELHISFSRYFLIFGFSLLISAAEWIFVIKKIPMLLQYAIHYIVLCAAFVFIFFTIRNASGEYQFQIYTVFAAAVIFSFIYVICIFAILTTRGAIAKGKEKDDIKKGKKPAYKPRFK